MAANKSSSAQKLGKRFTALIKSMNELIDLIERGEGSLSDSGRESCKPILRAIITKLTNCQFKLDAKRLESSRRFLPLLENVLGQEFVLGVSLAKPMESDIQLAEAVRDLELLDSYIGQLQAELEFCKTLAKLEKNGAAPVESRPKVKPAAEEPPAAQSISKWSDLGPLFISLDHIPVNSEGGEKNGQGEVTAAGELAEINNQAADNSISQICAESGSDVHQDQLSIPDQLVPIQELIGESGQDIAKFEEPELDPAEFQTAERILDEENPVHENAEEPGSELMEVQAWEPELEPIELQSEESAPESIELQSEESVPESIELQGEEPVSESIELQGEEPVSEPMPVPAAEIGQETQVLPWPEVLPDLPPSPTLKSPKLALRDILADVWDAPSVVPAPVPSSVPSSVPSPVLSPEAAAVSHALFDFPAPEPAPAQAPANNHRPSLAELLADPEPHNNNGHEDLANQTGDLAPITEADLLSVVPLDTSRAVSAWLEQDSSSLMVNQSCMLGVSITGGTEQNGGGDLHLSRFHNGGSSPIIIAIVAENAEVTPSYRSANLPRTGNMNPQFFRITAREEGPVSLTINICNASDLSLIEELKAELLCVSESATISGGRR